MPEYESHTFDVVVIGAGGAGLRAAIEASSRGARTALVCKSLLGKAHTVMAEGGIAAALANVDKEDDWKTHFVDTMKGGKMLNQWRMVQLHAQQAPDRVRELEQWGAVFDRTGDGRILQRAFGGHRWKRLAHVGDRTGLELIRTLQDRGVHLGIDVFMECTITHLLHGQGRIAGAFGYRRESGRFILFRARAIILATGGIGKAYKVTSNSWEYTGDGHAMAYRAGAELMDMEFVQFHPTGMVWPPSVAGTLVTEAVRGEGGILKNGKGERFMWRYLPEASRKDFAETPEEADEWVRATIEGRKTNARRPPELSTRDNVARAIYTEVKEGRGSPHGGCYLDISYQEPERVKKKLPSMYNQFKEFADIDITKEPMEVGPTAHYMMGGVRVNPETQESSVPGLFAAGECAAGLHGANRLGGNSLSDLLVFGRLAGAGAVETAKKLADPPEIDEAQLRAAEKELLAPFEPGEGENPYALHRELQETMSKLVGIFRKQDELETAIEKLQELRTRARRVKVEGNRLYNPAWHLSWDLLNMIDVSEAVARSALMRKESRGAHSRLDFPEPDERAGKVNVCVRLKNGSMEVFETPLPEMPAELKALFKESR